MNYDLDFSAVIFDLDGTLLYSLGEIAAAGNNALTRMGYPTHPVEAYRTFVGSGAKKLAWRILPEDQQNQEVYDKLLPLLLEEFELVLNTIARPYEGVMESLDALAAAGKTISILSNKPHEYTVETVKALLPDVDFFAVYGGRQEVPLKPAPDGALELAKAMGVEPQRTIFVGDSDVDMQTAVNAGMISVGAAWGFRGAEELGKAGAEIILENPIDLKQLI